MLRSVKEVKGLVLRAEDGEIGRCKDYLFDDEHWTVRYMVADTGKWIPDRKVLVSPMSLEDPDWSAKRLPVNLTKIQIEKSPRLKEHEPVSRQKVEKIHQYYGHPYYWVGRGIWGTEHTPAAWRARTDAERTDPLQSQGDPHLRSADEVTGYHVEATDGEIGHVEDLIIDDETWTLRYMVIDTRNWLPGRKVLVSTAWAEELDAVQRTAQVDLTKEQIENSPEYEPGELLNREFETRLFEHYGRTGYWEERES